MKLAVFYIPQFMLGSSYNVVRNEWFYGLHDFSFFHSGDYKDIRIGCPLFRRHDNYKEVYYSINHTTLKVNNLKKQEKKADEPDFFWSKKIETYGLNVNHQVFFCILDGSISSNATSNISDPTHSRACK